MLGRSFGFSGFQRGVSHYVSCRYSNSALTTDPNPNSYKTVLLKRQNQPPACDIIPRAELSDSSICNSVLSRLNQLLQSKICGRLVANPGLYSWALYYHRFMAMLSATGCLQYSPYYNRPAFIRLITTNQYNNSTSSCRRGYIMSGRSGGTQLLNNMQRMKAPLQLHVDHHHEYNSGHMLIHRAHRPGAGTNNQSFYVKERSSGELAARACCDDHPRAGCAAAASAQSSSLPSPSSSSTSTSADTSAVEEDDMVYRRTIYDHGDWARHRSSTRHSRHMMAIASSRVVAGLLPPVLRLTLVASTLVLFNTLVAGGFLAAVMPATWGLPLLHVSSLPFQLAAPALALLLVFRTNASYGRFDEARKAWGSVVNRSRDISRQAVTFIGNPADASKLHDLLRYVVVFSYCLKDHLTREDDLRKELVGIVEEADLDAIMSSPHRPTFALQMLTQIIHNSHLSDMQKALLDSNVSSFHDNVGACERLFSTPIPVSYTRLTSRTLVIWHLLLPLALWDQCTWATIPATFLSAAALFCIEEVGVLIEEPFSILPLTSMCKTIQKNVETIHIQQWFKDPLKSTLQ